MPYSKLDELPEAVKGIPTHAQEIWMAAFNSAWDQFNGDESRCAATAWAAVKTKYEKKGDQWVSLKSLSPRYILKEIPPEAKQGALSPSKEFQLLPLGQIGIEGEPPAFLTQSGAEKIISEFERRGNDMVVDYEHQTLSDQQAPAAGWINKIVNKGKDGLWAVVEWTEKAWQYIQAKEYRYFSPVFWIDQNREVTKVEMVALTNYPKMNNLRPIIAKMEDQWSVANDQLIQGLSPEIQFNNKRKEEEIMLEKLKKHLGLAADAAEEKVTEAAELLVNKVKSLEKEVACKEVLDAVGAKVDAGKDEVLQIIASLKLPADVAQKLSLEVASLRKELTEIKQNDLVQMALKDGKISPDELAKWGSDLALKNPEQFKLIVLSRPPGSVIPIGGIHQEPEKKDGKADETQLVINKMMGVSEESWKKYNSVKQ